MIQPQLRDCGFFVRIEGVRVGTDRPGQRDEPYNLQRTVPGSGMSHTASNGPSRAAG